ncbi:MAG: glutathionylspermidine synthase family protein [Ferrovibrio sp.]
MQRLAVEPCADWRERAEAAGFAASDATPRWLTDTAYSFSAADIDVLGDAAQALEERCLDWVEAITWRGAYEAFGFNDATCTLIEESWRRQDKNLIGRIDLAWDGRDAPRMLRYAADAPDSVIEAAVLQAEWLDCTCNHCDQFNGIHDMLIDAWKHFGLWGHRVHFAALRDDAAGRAAADYLQSTARAAGLDTGALVLEDLRWNGKRFADQSAKPITVLYKHCPWSDLLQHPLAANLRSAGMRLIEPAWKLLLTRDATLPALRAAYPDDDHLLPIAGEYAATLGVWVVASRPCGLGITESDNAGTHFVPHRFE